MSSGDTLNCANHPDRIALERCEVCGKPLCAYCLYYTEDGQRLCEEHAAEARRLGAVVEEPGAYADQLLGAQMGAARKSKRMLAADDDGLYKGNSTDLTGLLGLLVALLSLVACCGAGYCLPLVGFVLSAIALINARQAHDPRRTRRLGVIGLVLSGVWVVVIAACILIYGLSLSSMVSAVRGPVWLWPTQSAATSTPATPPAATPTPVEVPSNAALPALSPD